MRPEKIRIGLAALRHPESIPQGVEKVAQAIRDAAAEKVEILCCPETYLPGLRGASFQLPPPDQKAQEEALEAIRLKAREHHVAVIIGMEWVSPIGLLNLAYVISAQGRVLGYQAKNQITPDGEDRYYVPDRKRRIFTLQEVPIGIVICHEGWRYPETVRWATTRGALIIFQPQVTGSDAPDKPPPPWGESFYEKAMLCRAQENNVFFASVNTAMGSQNSATSLISPEGECLAYVPCGEEQLLVHDLDLRQATRFHAKRYNPDFYPP